MVYFLYADYLHTTQETYLWTSTACYGYTFTFSYVDDVLIPRKHIHALSRPITEIALLLYRSIWFVPHRKQLLVSTACYGDRFTFVYVDVRTSQETLLWTSAACYRDGFTALSVDKVRTSQEIPMSLHGLWTYGPLRPVTGMALLYFSHLSPASSMLKIVQRRTST
jgi:hypothetical protein